MINPEHFKENVIEIQNLTVTYSTLNKVVLDNITLALPKQSLIGIIGPNGAGKSTLLKTIMGLVPHQKGYIKLWGKSIDQIRKQVSYIPQKEAVDWDFPACVFDIALLGRYNRLKFFERPNKLDKSITMECLEKVGMKDMAKQHISTLSGGQRQRLFLARALAQDAQLYFMDEPFAGIDMITEQAIVAILKEMVALGKTIVVVHHNLGSVLDYFDWLVLLNHKLIAAGPTQTIFTITLLEETYKTKFPCFQYCFNDKS